MTAAVTRAAQGLIHAFSVRGTPQDTSKDALIRGVAIATCGSIGANAFFEAAKPLTGRTFYAMAYGASLIYLTARAMEPMTKPIWNLSLSEMPKVSFSYFKCWIKGEKPTIESAIENQDAPLVHYLTSREAVSDAIEQKDIRQTMALPEVLGPHRAMGLALILHHGADVNQKDLDGNTPLAEAADQGNVEAIIALIKNGANWTIKNDEGKTFVDLLKKPSKKDLERIERAIEKQVFNKLLKPFMALNKSLIKELPSLPPAELCHELCAPLHLQIMRAHLQDDPVVDVDANRRVHLRREAVEEA